jgi:hypothetical protein
MLVYGVKKAKLLVFNPNIEGIPSKNSVRGWEEDLWVEVDEKWQEQFMKKVKAFYSSYLLPYHNSLEHEEISEKFKDILTKLIDTDKIRPEVYNGKNEMKLEK